MSPNITLTQDQENALMDFQQFLGDPDQKVMVIQGYAGCGKSTLLRAILDYLPALETTLKLLNRDFITYPVMFTATTNKAAESLKQILGQDVMTIHSALGYYVDQEGLLKRKTYLGSHPVYLTQHNLVFIDEASYLDPEFLSTVLKELCNNKIVFIGDPAQLTPIKHSYAPVFNKNFPSSHLTEVVRQDSNNPIIDLSTKFRETVNTGKFFSFKPDGYHVQHLNEQDFNKAIEEEFTREDWKYSDSKVLAWRNATVIRYNAIISELVTGNPNFKEGDYAVVNNYASKGGKSYKTGQVVHISEINAAESYCSVEEVLIDGTTWFFRATDYKEWQNQIKTAVRNNNHKEARELQTWIDLRANYACTVNKAQGSTFDKVFIDLNDIRRCNSGNQIARMLYVAVSRARHQVIFTGDLI